MHGQRAGHLDLTVARRKLCAWRGCYGYRLFRSHERPKAEWLADLAQLGHEGWHLASCFSFGFLPLERDVE